MSFTKKHLIQLCDRCAMLNVTEYKTVEAEEIAQQTIHFIESFAINNCKNFSWDIWRNHKQKKEESIIAGRHFIDTLTNGENNNE